MPDGYTLGKSISSTRSAQVWQARDSRGALIVLKNTANNALIKRRFEREIKSMRLAAGPHVMPVLDWDDSYSWYSMPYAAKTLYEIQVPTSFEESLLVLEAITEALRPIHAKHQVHRDLKPQNILWLENESGARWVVADFGIVRNPAGLTTQQLTHAGGLTGSEGWAAPEQHVDAHASTITADVYAAGAIFSWMMTGIRPNYGYVTNVDHNPQLRAVIRKATAPKPHDRFANLDDFLKAVQDSKIVSTASLTSLIQAEDWPRVSLYVGQSQRLTQILAALPNLSQAQIYDWLSADRAGLILAVSESWDNLRDGYKNFQFGEIDKFLSWGVKVLWVLVNKGMYDDAEQVGASLFAATAEIHQFKPADDILDWMDDLTQQAQQSMETALYSSSSLSFFKERAQKRWRSKAKSDLVQRLQEQ